MQYLHSLVIYLLRNYNFNDNNMYYDTELKKTWHYLKWQAITFPFWAILKVGGLQGILPATLGTKIVLQRQQLYK